MCVGAWAGLAVWTEILCMSVWTLATISQNFRRHLVVIMWNISANIFYLVGPSPKRCQCGRFYTEIMSKAKKIFSQTGAEGGNQLVSPFTTTVKVFVSRTNELTHIKPWTPIWYADFCWVPNLKWILLVDVLLEKRYESHDQKSPFCHCVTLDGSTVKINLLGPPGTPSWTPGATWTSVWKPLNYNILQRMINCYLHTFFLPSLLPDSSPQ